MTLSQKLMEISKEMTDDMLSEVIDFVESIRIKDNKDQKELVDKFIKDNDIALKELSK